MKTALTQQHEDNSTPQMTGGRYMDTPCVDISSPAENDPSNFPRNNSIRGRLAAKFHDSDHWGELAGKYLDRYNLPAADVPCDPTAMARWLDRLDMTEKQYSQATNTGLADFCALNPTWPLRAWIGLILEFQAENLGDRHAPEHLQ
ncbi:MAG: hypothetical protein ACYC1T_02765 [Sulfuricaulis sp.]